MDRVSVCQKDGANGSVPPQMHWRLISPPPPLSPPSPSTAASATHGLACFQRTLIIAYLFPSFSLPLVPSRPLSPSLPLSLSPSLPSSSPPAQTHWRLISPPPPPSPPSPGTAASASHPTPPVLFPSLPPLPPHPTSTDALAPHLASSPALTTISLHRCFGLSPHTVSLLLEASRKPGSVLTALVFSHVDRLSLRHVAPPDTAIPSAAQSEPPKEDEDGRMSFLGLTQKREEEGEWWEMTCKGGGGEWGLGSCALTRVSPALPLRPLSLVHVLTRFPSFTAHPPSRPPSSSPQPHLTSLLPSSTLSSAPTPFFPAFPLSALLPSALSQSAAAHCECKSGLVGAGCLQGEEGTHGMCAGMSLHSCRVQGWPYTPAVCRDVPTLHSCQALPARVLQLLAFRPSVAPTSRKKECFETSQNTPFTPSVLRRLKTLLLSRALCCPHNGLLCLSGSCFPILSLTRSLPAFLHSCYSPNLLPSFQALCCPHFELLCLTPFTTILCFPSSLIPSLCHSLSHPIALPSLFPPTPLTTPPIAGPQLPPSRAAVSQRGSRLPILPHALFLRPSWGEGEARRQVQLGGLQWGVMQAGGVQWGAVQPGGVQWGEGEARRQVQLGEMRAGLGELRLGVWGGREAQRQVQLGEMRAGLGELRLGAWGGREAQRQPRGQVQRQVRPGEALGGVAVLLERLQLVEVSFWEKGEVDDMRDVISSLPHPPLLLDLSTDRGALIAAHISRHAARIHARAAQGVSHAAAHTRWHLPSFAGASGQVVLLQAGADMAVGNRGEETPLYIASLKCHLWVVLLQAGADMAVGNRGEETPLYIASLKCHLWVVLLQAGADMAVGNRGEETPLYIASLKGHLWVVRRLLGHCRRRGLDWQGDASLHRGGSGWTPLMAAALSNHTHVLHTLLTHHVHTHQSQDDTSSPALINKQNTYGLTALHIAARYGSLDCIQSLLAAGAFTAVPDLYGERPSGLARRFGHSEAVQLLLAVEGVEIGLGGEEDGDNGSKGGDEGKDGKGGKGKRARRKGRKAKGIEEN
ncbi:unnamed protein product [Closterium sp. NIES-64]|nr:unnamed protein product [Closterium sp. NIES-64]